MRTYADTSFLVKLLIEEPGTRAAMAEYHHLKRPPVFFLPLHALEVANAIRQRAFHQRHTLPSSNRFAIKREHDTSLALLQKYISRRIFIEISHNMDTAIELASSLSAKHTERLGCRGFDLLHVALALELECEAFLTADRIQGALAQAEGLAVTISADE
ncbi:MAG TPA: type II toxin-antitoxin system VapC family toxin [Verrucomicrobiae bacterium]|jgi:predicted nucleic acid-binding protein